MITLKRIQDDVLRLLKAGGHDKSRVRKTNARVEGERARKSSGVSIDFEDISVRIDRFFLANGGNLWPVLVDVRTDVELTEPCIAGSRCRDSMILDPYRSAE